MSNSTGNVDAEFWRALYEVLQDAQQTLAYADEPDRVHWTHPDEEWKNDAELSAIEEDCASEISALIQYYCQRHEWPKRSKNNSRFFVARRIAWALPIVRLFTIPLNTTGSAAVSRPHHSGFDLIRWLLTDAYENRFPPRQKTPFFISGSDGKSIEVWT